MEQQFKYIYAGKEVSKEEFTNITKELFKWFDNNTINAVDFDSVSNFFSGDYKSNNEIDKHFRGVLENHEKAENDGSLTAEEKRIWTMLNPVLKVNLKEREYPNLGDYLNKEQKVIEDWNKKDYNTTTVKVNCSPDDLVKLNTLRDGLLNSDFKPNSLEDIADLISAKEGIKETENKVNYGELDWDYIDNMSLRMSKNLDKYPPKNWQKKLDIQELAKSAIRHARKILQEIDNDEETLQQHATALGCNGMMINYQLKNNLK